MAKAGGKWQFLKDKFKRMPLEATQQQLIDAVLDAPAPDSVLSPADKALGGMTVRCLSDFQLQKLYLAARDRSDILTAEASALVVEIEAYTRAFIDRFEEAGEFNKTFADGVQIGISVEPYPSVKDKPVLYQWIKDTDQSELLTLNYQTMVSIVKSKLEAGQPLPPGVDVFLKDKLTCRNRNCTK